MKVVASLLVAALILTAFPRVERACADVPATQTAADSETRFMERMAAHHHIGVELAQLGAEKSVHVELEEMCVGVVVTQSAEIRRMWGWLQKWHHIVAAEPPDATKMRKQLAGLSGGEFEIALMEMMIEHHKKGIREARAFGASTSRAELAQLCREMVGNQTANVAEMNTWLCDWYLRCR